MQRTDGPEAPVHFVKVLVVTKNGCDSIRVCAPFDCQGE